jgi:hypothetical protein
MIKPAPFKLPRRRPASSPPRCFVTLPRLPDLAPTYPPWLPHPLPSKTRRANTLRKRDDDGFPMSRKCCIIGKLSNVSICVESVFGWFV